MKLKLVLGVIAVVITAGVAGALLHSSPKNTALADNVPFQPEAQMLYSATQPTDSLQRPERAQASSSRNTALPYAFNTKLCSDQTANGTIHFNCYETYYDQLVDKYGVDVAFSDLKKRYESDPYVVSNCHPLTHVIGRESVSLYPDVSQAYEHGDSFCWSGYFHGVLEAIVKNIGATNLPAKMDTICANIPGKATYSFDYYNCVHGLGHGVMELGDDDVFTSLTQCDNLTGSWERQSCYSGVFMENIILFDRDGSAPDLKPAEPLYPCTAVGDRYKYECYLGQTSFVLQQNRGDFKSTFDVCATIERTYRSVCNQSIGRDAANYANHDGARTKTTCSLAASPEDTTDCVIGAVKEIISYYHSTTQAETFCNLLTDDKATCLATSEQYFKSF